MTNKTTFKNGKNIYMLREIWLIRPICIMHTCFGRPICIMPALINLIKQTIFHIDQPLYVYKSRINIARNIYIILVKVLITSFYYHLSRIVFYLFFTKINLNLSIQNAQLKYCL